MEIESIKDRLNEIIFDHDIVTDIIEKLDSTSSKKLNESIEAIFKSNGTNNLITSFSEFVKNEDITQNITEDLLLEAIIHFYGRPALLILNDKFEKPICPVLFNLLEKNISNIETAIKSVGRIEIKNHETFDWVGTGWLVADDVIATNRHVAEIFSFAVGSKLLFKSNFSRLVAYKPSIDFKREFQNNMHSEFEITKVIHLAKQDEPDLALLRVRKVQNNSALPPRILLDNNVSDKVNRDIAIIGYPQLDHRNRSSADMHRIFNNTYGVKRLQPGKITDITSEEYFMHDCSTLGGNSGSPIIDIVTGKVLGIHFGGKYLEKNFAVSSSHISKVLNKTIGL